jgi:hypothetical protein
MRDPAMTDDTADPPPSTDNHPAVVSAATDPSAADPAKHPSRPATDTLPYHPIPDSWLRYSHHPRLTRGTARVYAVEAVPPLTGSTLTIRYIHPVNDHSVHRTIPAVDTDTGPVPKPAYRGYQADHPAPDTLFQASLGVPALAPTTPPEPTPTERRLLWALHGSFLLTHTRYQPPTEKHDPTT